MCAPVNASAHGIAQKPTYNCTSYAYVALGKRDKLYDPFNT